MKILLDTHTFLWWTIDSPQLSAKAREIISKSHSEIFFSAVSAWEIAIKAQLGRLQLPDRPRQFILHQLNCNEFNPLMINVAHALFVYELPDIHQDPFDRLLIAQARIEKMMILTRDLFIPQYQVQTIW